nr:hypothetical protein [Tanacetum cinerariifolium]
MVLGVNGGSRGEWCGVVREAGKCGTRVFRGWREKLCIAQYFECRGRQGRKPKRKNTQVPQPSGSIEHVTDEAVYKELDDILVRATTTASILETEQDNGNIDKTQSRATPNEASSPGATSGGGPRCHKAIGDRIGQTRFENVSKLSNDLLLTRGEDASKQGRIKAIDVDEDITLVNNQDDTKMFDVNDLHVEDINTAKLIVDVTRVNAAGEVNVASIATDDSVVATITTDDITLAKALLEIKTIKPKAKGIVLEELSESTTTTKTIYLKQSHDKGKGIMDDVQAKIDADYQMAKRLQAEEQQELTDEEKATLFMQFLEKKRKFFAAKRAEEKRNKPPTQAQKRKIMCTYLENMKGYTLKQLKSFEFDKIQEMFDRAFIRVNTFEPISSELGQGKEKRAGEELTQERSKKQKVDDDKETFELKKLMEIIPNKEEVAINAIPLAIKSPKIFDWKIYKEGKKSYYQIIRADGNYKMYMVFNRMLKEFDREDLEDLYNLVKAKYGSTRPVEDLDLLYEVI